MSGVLINVELEQNREDMLNSKTVEQILALETPVFYFYFQKKCQGSHNLGLLLGLLYSIFIYAHRSCSLPCLPRLPPPPQPRYFHCFFFCKDFLPP